MRVRAVAAWIAVASLTFFSSAPAQAVGSFYAAVVYEGPLGPVTVPINNIRTSTGPLGDLIGTVTNWTCITACLPGDFGITDLDITFDTDPVITFNGNVLDFGAPSAFSFIFSQSIVPTPAPGVATSSLSGSTTNGGGVTGVVSISPNAPPAGISQDPGGVDEIMVYSLSTNGAVTWQNVGIDLGPAFSSNPGLVSDTYGPFNSAAVAGPAGSGNYTDMRVDVNFTLSGGNDRFTFNGDATIVPEVSTGLEIALGLLGFGLLRRRRQS